MTTTDIEQHLKSIDNTPYYKKPEVKYMDGVDRRTLREKLWNNTIEAPPKVPGWYEIIYTTYEDNHFQYFHCPHYKLLKEDK